MKFQILFFLFFSMLAGANAQIDARNKSIAIPAIKAEESIPETTPMPLPEPEVLEPELPRSLPEKTKKEFSMVDHSSTIRNPAELYKKRLKRALKIKNEEKRYNGSTTNINYGVIPTNVSRVNVVYRDHQYPDGDLIRVHLNDKVVQPRVLLQTQYNGLRLDLVKGLNKIDFEALNQGQAGPNTAEFKILDEQGNVLATHVWNLATGVKASIIVHKQ